MDRTRRRTIRWSTVAIAAITAAVVAPLTAWAQQRFADVPPWHVFAEDVSGW